MPPALHYERDFMITAKELEKLTIGTPAERVKKVEDYITSGRVDAKKLAGLLVAILNVTKKNAREWLELEEKN